MPVLFAIVEFGNKHFSPDGPAVVVVDSTTMEVAEPVVVDAKTGVSITSSRFTIASTGRANRQTQAKYPLQVCKPKPKRTAGAKAAKRQSTPKPPAKSAK